MQRFRTRTTTDGAAVVRLTALHRRLLAGAAATVVVWAAAPAERPAHAAEVPADGGDTTLRLERLSDLPTTVRLAVGKARLVETGGPGVRSRSQGWTFVNDGLVLSEGDGVRMAGDAVRNSAGAVILGLRGVLLGGADATGVLSVDNAGTILGADGVGVRITGETARLVNHQNGLIGGIGGRAAVLRGGEISVDNQGRITSSSHVGLKMAADDDALLENGQTGLIVGTGRGAVVDGHAVTVVNDGAIAGARPADDQDGAARDALGLLARGDQVVVVNRATGLIVGDDQGLRALSDQGALIDNAGVILGLDGDGGDGAIRLVNRDTGVVIGGNGTVLAGAAVEVDNSGALLAPDDIAQPVLSVFDSDETRIINRLGGTIDGSGVGIDVTGGDVELINDGFIRSGIADDNGLGGLDVAVLITDAEDLLIENDGWIEGADGIVVFTADEVEITNDTAGEVHGGYGSAVAVEADIVRIGNEGLLRSAFGTGVEVVAGASGLVENTGVILGGETGVFGAADVMTLRNQGVITAGLGNDDGRDPVAVDLTGGTVTLVNDDGGVVSGDTGALLHGVDRAAIDNAGLITGADVVSDGVVSVTNRAGGEIAGDSLGLLVTAPVVEVTNGGTIASVDTAAIDIDAPDRATVHNTTTGLVSAVAAPAVQIRAGDTRVINDGQVTGASGFLIDGDATLTNSASGTIETVDTAVFVTGTATVVNAGRIITEAGVVPADVPDAAVAVGSGGGITNLEGGVILNRYWAGISVTDGTGMDDPADRETVIGNAGLIRSEGPGIGVRVQVAGGVTVSNALSGTIAAADARGVAIQADRIGVENAGMIVGEGGEGIFLRAADEATVDNAGTIIGGVFDTAEQLQSGVSAEGGTLNVVNRDGGVIVGETIGIGLLAREVAAIENAGFTNGIFVQGGDVALLTNAASGVVAADDVNGLVGDEVAVDNAGIISGGDMGLIIQGATARIVNTGRIDGVAGAGIVSAATGTTSIANAGIITGALVGVAVDGVVAIDNAGTISGGGTAISAAGGSVVNRADGEISGAVAISASGDDVGIVNAGGLIKGDAVAIAVEGDGTIVDNGAGAEITAEGDTIHLMGEALIVNAGTIRSTGAVAIIVEGDALVDNAEDGVIEAAGPAMILAGVTSLTNAGRISSTDPTFDGDDDDGVAVLAGSGGLIANTGVIDSGAGAVLIGDVDTVTDVAELETVIANDGLIQAHGEGTALGADVEGAVAVANSNTIAAEDGPAVDLVAADILLGNSGTIISESGTGASLAAGIVSVSNGAGALIGGGDVGLAIQGGHVDVANGGVITGANAGLAVGGDAVTVDNQGDILAMSDGETSEAVAIAVTAITAEVTNRAGAVAAGETVGIQVTATDGAVLRNDGFSTGVDIHGGSDAVLENGTDGAIISTSYNGVHATDMVRVDNAGLLLGPDAGLGIGLPGEMPDEAVVVNRDTGRIIGAGAGLVVEAGAAEITNDGIISGGTGNGATVFAMEASLANTGQIVSTEGDGVVISADTVDVVNAASGVIAGAAIGLAVGGDAVTVDNQGEISGETGVVLRGGADGAGDGAASQLTLVNRGTIDGGVVFQGGDSNFADIGGRVAADEAGRAVVFADGASTRDLIVETGAVIGGDILAGTDNTLEQARLRRDSVALFSGAGRFEHDLQGFGLIDKTGAGIWRLDGDLLAAAFDITGGGVALNGHYTGDRLSVGGGGALSGTGRISGDLINAGTVAPGNSIGTLTVTGDYTQTSTGRLAMEYADDGAGGALTDRLVVGGAADIQGGTLALTSFDGSTPRYASAGLLTAAGGVTGGFDRVETDRAGLLGGVLIEGNVISLRLVDTANGFRALAETETARGVAGVLEAQALTATGDRDVLLTQLAALDDAGAAAALGDLAGTEYAGHWRYLRSTGRAFVDGAAQAGRAGHRGAWITGFGNAGRTSGEDAVGDVRWRSAGTAIGIDFAVGEDARLGLAAGVTDGRMSGRDRDADIDTTGWHVGAYGAVPAGPLMLDAAVAFTRASSDASRGISGTGRTASGSFDTDQITASVGVSTDLIVPGAKPGTPEAKAGTPAWTVTPMLRLTFDHQRSDDVTETGAGAASLRVEGATVQGLEAFAGVRFGASFGDVAAGDVVVRPSFTLGIGQELLDRDNSLMASFADDPANRFQVNGVSQGRTTGRFGAEVAVDVAAGVTIGAAYAGSIDETGDDHRLTAGLRLSW